MVGQVIAVVTALLLLLAVASVQAQTQSPSPQALSPQSPPAAAPATGQAVPADDAPAASASPEAPLAAVPPPAAEAAPDPAANGSFRPGLLHELGRMLEDSVNKLNSNLKGASGAIESLGSQTNEAVKGAAGAAKDAADLTAGAAGNIVALPANRVVTGRAKCEAAPNGAPDCRIAANVLCRGKGFGQGSSLDVESAEKCPVQTWLSGRQPKRGECGVETFVTRAACR